MALRQRETSLSFSIRLCVSSLVMRRESESESAKSLIYIAVTHIYWLYSCRAFSAQLSSFDVFLYSRPCIFIRMHQHVIRFFLSSFYRFLFKIFIALSNYSLSWKIAFPTSTLFSTRNKNSWILSLLLLFCVWRWMERHFSLIIFKGWTWQGQNKNVFSLG